jgi:hypothetical protein
MTDTERLILEGLAATLQAADYIAHAVETVLPGEIRVVEEKIKAVLDSQTADEVDALR